jgi:poly-gamma-glutamate synthesis protein (capsule biosynthesis protein)
MMRLLFLGDISIPHSFHISEDIDMVFSEADVVIANLEGAILPQNDMTPMSKRGKIVLANTTDVLDVLKAFQVRAVCLANNHLYDTKLPALHTKNILQTSGIDSFGAGANLYEASNPYIVTLGSTKVQVFAFGWNVIGCHPATRTREGVNPFEPDHMVTTIKKLRATDSTSCVIFLLHWNYELEKYPQPAHRQLAHDLIRAGVDGIVGMHSHVASGAEMIDGKPVIYGLGNWLFPPRKIGHFSLRYPAFASRELAVEIAIHGRHIQDVHFHWYQWDSETGTHWQEQIEGWDGNLLQQLTPYAGMSNQEYRQWFRHNRTVRRGLPIYDDYTRKSCIMLKNGYTLLRQVLIHLLIRLRLKKSLRLTTSEERTLHE